MALGLYLHIPFCPQKCHYCDFVSYPMAEAELVEIFLQNPGQEMELYSRSGVCMKKLASLYFGGGTLPVSLPGNWFGFWKTAVIFSPSRMR